MARDDRDGGAPSEAGPRPAGPFWQWNLCVPEKYPLRDAFQKISQKIEFQIDDEAGLLDPYFRVEPKCTSISYEVKGGGQFKILLLHIPVSVLWDPNDDDFGRLCWLREMIYATLKSKDFPDPKLALIVPDGPGGTSDDIIEIFAEERESMVAKLVPWANIKALEDRSYEERAIERFLAYWAAFDLERLRDGDLGTGNS
jgi:hypothetical protein